LTDRAIFYQKEISPESQAYLSALKAKVNEIKSQLENSKKDLKEAQQRH
jgi:hypothetical protein